jgi:hypothetical protein
MPRFSKILLCNTTQQHGNQPLSLFNKRAIEAVNVKFDKQMTHKRDMYEIFVWYVKYYKHAHVAVLFT